MLWDIPRDEQYNISMKLIRVIQNMYSKCFSKVRGPGIESSWFNIDIGVKQGITIAFVIFMDKCIRDIGMRVHRGRFTVCRSCGAYYGYR